MPFAISPTGNRASGGFIHASQSFALPKAQAPASQRQLSITQPSDPRPLKGHYSDGASLQPKVSTPLRSKKSRFLTFLGMFKNIFIWYLAMSRAVHNVAAAQTAIVHPGVEGFTRLELGKIRQCLGPDLGNAPKIFHTRGNAQYVNGIIEWNPDRGYMACDNVYLDPCPVLRHEVEHHKQAKNLPITTNLANKLYHPTMETIHEKSVMSTETSLDGARLGRKTHKGVTVDEGKAVQCTVRNTFISPSDELAHEAFRFLYNSKQAPPDRHNFRFWPTKDLPNALQQEINKALALSYKAVLRFNDAQHLSDDELQKLITEYQRDVEPIFEHVLQRVAVEEKKYPRYPWPFA